MFENHAARKGNTLLTACKRQSAQLADNHTPNPVENDQQDKAILAPGTLVNGYQIIREIGHGSTAVVYLAKQLDLGRNVALKILSTELAQNAEYVSRFINEARATATLSHQNIIQAIDAGVAPGNIYFFCMEYVDGESLMKKIQDNGPLPPDDVRTWGLQIADALNYGFQTHTFTHGDIKPENILINSHNQAKLADFGLAKVEDHDFEGHELILTPLYASPELILGKRSKSDCRTDIYAFGATLYHALAGSPPYPGSLAKEVMEKQLHEPLEPLVHRNPNVPLIYSELISQMLAKDPEARIQNWSAIINALEHLGPSRIFVTSHSQIAEHKQRTMHRKSALAPAEKKKNYAVIFSSLFFLLLVCLVALALGYIFGKFL